MKNNKFLRLLSWVLLLWLLAGQSYAQDKMVRLNHFNHSDYTSNCNDPINEWCYTDVWGYTAPDGREYALMTATGFGGPWTGIGGNENQGLVIIDITDPLNPEHIVRIPAPQDPNNTTWPVKTSHHDVKTYYDPVEDKTYAYVVADKNWRHKWLSIVDLSGLPNPPSYSNPTVTAFGPTDEDGSVHNIFIDQSTGTLITTNDANGIGSGLNILDINSPTAPIVNSLALSLLSGIHDVFMRDNKIFMAGGTMLQFYDINSSIGNSFFYPNDQGGTSSHPPHDIWVSDDGHTMVTSDERKSGDAIFWNIDNFVLGLGNPVELGRFNAKGDMNQHNHVIKGNDLCYTAHYTHGLVVIDFSDPTNPVEKSYYDTYLQNNNAGYRGAWGVYPFLPSGNILVGDMNMGLQIINDCVPFQSQHDQDNLELGNTSVLNEVKGWAARVEIDVAPTNSFDVGLDGIVSLIAGERIHIGPGLNVTNGGRFHAQIGPMCGECNKIECNEEEEGGEGSGGNESLQKLGQSQGEAPKDRELVVYPNPATDYIQVRIPEMEEGGEAQLTLHNEMGTVISSVNRTADQNSRLRIDVSGFSPGVYVLKLQLSNGEMTQKKVVITPGN